MTPGKINIARLVERWIRACTPIPSRATAGMWEDSGPAPHADFEAARNPSFFTSNYTVARGLNIGCTFFLEKEISICFKQNNSGNLILFA